jgi:hypothetical protein
MEILDKEKVAAIRGATIGRNSCPTTLGEGSKTGM